MLGALLSKIGSVAKVAGKGVAKGAAKGINKREELLAKKKALKKKATKKMGIPSRDEARRKALMKVFGNSGLSEEAMKNLLR